MSGSVLPDNWRKSSASGAANDCVEVANNAKFGAIRDTQNPGPMIVVPRVAFDALLRSVLVNRPTS